MHKGGRVPGWRWVDATSSVRKSKRGPLAAFALGKPECAPAALIL